MNIYIYIIRRLIYMVPILVGVTLLIFFMFNILAGDPTITLLGQHATTKQIATLQHELGLDRPWYIQYFDVLKSTFTFDFGRSWHSKQQISSIIKSGAGVSFTFVLPAFLISAAISITISLFAAFFRGRFVDKALVVGCVIMMSISALAYILFGQWLFAYKLNWFEIAGYEAGFPDCIPYIVLPAFIIVILNIGSDVRFYRTIILDEIYQDYVRTARAKGLSEIAVLFKHVLKNAMIPIITNLIIQLPLILIGTILIESFFAMPGLGSIILNAINTSDFPVIKAMTIIVSVVYIFFNLITDIVYTLVDPRIRL